MRTRTVLLFYIASMGVLFLSLGLALLLTLRVAEATVISLPPVFYLNTLLVLASSYTYWRAGHAAQAGNPPRVLLWLWMTALLTALFATGQVLGFMQLAGLNIYLTNNVYASYLYVLAGAHGLHLLGAFIVLVLLLIRAAQARIHPSEVQLLGIFWHSLGALWLGILLVLRGVYG
ncbi:MAG: cytochrome c oxidase subunit 3 [Bacteroidetes bacterium]|nr:cytochrome c oxidase subunit 3 [Bacteroidota bacterium]